MPMNLYRIALSLYLLSTLNFWRKAHSIPLLYSIIIIILTMKRPRGKVAKLLGISSSLWTLNLWWIRPFVLQHTHTFQDIPLRNTTYIYIFWRKNPLKRREEKVILFNEIRSAADFYKRERESGLVLCLW